MKNKLLIFTLFLVGSFAMANTAYAKAINLRQDRFEIEVVIEQGNFDFHLDGYGFLQFLHEVAGDLEALGTAGKTLREFEQFETDLLAVKELRIQEYKTIIRFANIYLSESMHAGDVRVFDVKENVYLRKVKPKKYTDSKSSGYKFISVETKIEVFSYITSNNSSTSF